MKKKEWLIGLGALLGGMMLISFAILLESGGMNLYDFVCLAFQLMFSQQLFTAIYALAFALQAVAGFMMLFERGGRWKGAVYIGGALLALTLAYIFTTNGYVCPILEGGK